MFDVVVLFGAGYRMIREATEDLVGNLIVTNCRVVGCLVAFLISR